MRFLGSLSAFVVALVATSGSLYYSEAMYFHPCSLCWVQRFLMYPLVPLLLLSLVYRDARIHRYVLPFSSVGLAVAAYHYSMQWGVIPQDACYDATCSLRYVNGLGFITIPFQSLTAFALIALAMTPGLRAKS